jgi:hypothetical protein
MRPGLIGIAVSVVLLAGSGRAARAEEINKPPRGFQALFNGKDLANWQGLVELPKRAELKPDELKEAHAKADEAMRAHWSVKDGVLTFDGKGQSLQTARDYGNFELYVDWRIPKEGDSGIYLRGNPQVQIWEASAKPAQNPDGTFIGSGGLYNNQKHPSKPLVVADRPAGEWNTFYIKMIGDKVTVKLNDKLVVDNVPLENYWAKDKPLPAKGPIELQNHSNFLEFRNIYIKELPDDAAGGAAPQAAAAPEPENLISLEVQNVPLAQVIQILAANGNMEIILQDPEGKLANQKIAFVSIRQKPVEKVIAVVCKVAGLEFTQDKNGVYFLSAKR